MLNKRQFLVGLIAVQVLAGPAMAQDFAADLQARLKSEGFRIESIGRTLLGRVRIVAQSSSGQREIILNPRTGEILRDLWITGGRNSSGQSPQGGNGGGQGGGDDDDDDDDEDDDEDNSGHGGGGGGNSGKGGND
jgi:hypothetical protein